MWNISNILNEWSPLLWCVCTIVALLTVYTFRKFFYVKNGPPGPTGIPFLGFLPQSFGQVPYEFLDSLVKRYGDIMSIRVLGRRYVVISSYDALRQAYIVQGDKFLDRPLDFSVLASIFDFKGLAFINGEEWKRQRKTLVSTIRLLDREGSEVPSLESRIKQSINWFHEELGQTHSKNLTEPIDIYKSMARALVSLNGNIISSDLLAETDSTTTEQIIEDTHLAFNLSPGEDGWLAGKFLQLLNNRFTSKGKIISKLRERVFRLMEQHLKGRERSPTDSPRDYVEALLIANEPTETRAILANMFIFYVAGTDTSCASIYTGVYCLAKYQDIQRKLHEELDSVLGPNAEIRRSDQKRLPYIDSVIKEVLRYSVVGPIPQPRQTTTEVNLNGYHIPAKTHIITNLWTATRDPKYFLNPLEFDPMNFYRRNLPRDLYLLPFSLGKRGCPGSALAEADLFLFLTHLFQKYTINLSPKFRDIPEQIQPGFSRLMKPFTVELKLRDQSM